MSAQNDELDPEDLVARARREGLSRAEQSELTLALEHDATLATAYRLGCEIDRASAVQAGDEALIARAADAALARAAKLTAQPGSRHAPRWAAAAAIALSIVCASGIAAALWSDLAIGWPFRIEPRDSSPAIAEPNAKPRAKRARIVVAAPKLEAPAPEPALAPAPALPALSAPAETPSRPRKPPGASELFHDANAARRSGELTRARRLYAALIDEHPSSDEAGLARVSLGKLLLAAGDAHGAEREFRRYLAAGGGQLAEEALVGQAQSFGRLQRAKAERHAWQRLLAAHPSSVYAAQATQRLSVLDAQLREGTP